MNNEKDNFDLIIPLLNFESEDDFYFVQIIQRKKDNPGNINGSNNSSRLIKGYYIKSKEELLKQKEEMITLAQCFNARVGINLNKRSFYKTAFNTLKKIAEQIHNKEFRNIKSAYNTCCGIHNGSDKVWIIDIDKDDVENIENMINVIDFECQPLTGKNLFGHETKILVIIPSKSGYHIITKAFDTRNFIEKYPNIEIHKNNPTNLYIP